MAMRVSLNHEVRPCRSRCPMRSPCGLGAVSRGCCWETPERGPQLSLESRKYEIGHMAYCLLPVVMRSSVATRR